MERRRFLALSLLAVADRALAEVDYASVEPRTLVFPRDHGAHPEFRTEWWYVTGWLKGRGPGVGRAGHVLSQPAGSCRVEP